MAKINDSVHALNLSGKIVESGRLTKLLKFEGMKKIPVNEVNTGDIMYCRSIHFICGRYHLLT